MDDSVCRNNSEANLQFLILRAEAVGIKKTIRGLFSYNEFQCEFHSQILRHQPGPADHAQMIRRVGHPVSRPAELLSGLRFGKQLL